MTTTEALQILDLSAPISRAELKNAYRDALMVWHPDRFQGSGSLRDKAQSKTYQINEAYALLSRISESEYPFKASEQTRQAGQHPPPESMRQNAAPAPPSQGPQSRTPGSRRTLKKSPDALTVAAWVVVAVACVLLIALITHIQPPKKPAGQVLAGSSKPQSESNTAVSADKVLRANVPLSQTSTLEEVRLQAEKGNAIAQRLLGMRFSSGEGVTKDNAEAVKWLRKSAEQGDAVAQLELSRAYYEGAGVEKDNAAFLNWLVKSAEKANAGAQYVLGVAYEQGEVVPKDDVQAVRLFRLAAEQGYAKAQLKLALSYINGVGVPQDRTEALKWFRKAADQGDAEAQFNLGFSYAAADGADQDLVEAVKWYRLAAEQGYSEAQYFLGRAYIKGEGVIENVELGAAWLRKAAEQGDDQAMNDMGEYYYVKMEPTTAMVWFRRGAESGNSSAQYNLGLSLANGEGVAVDEVEAHLWWSIAASQGHTQASEDLKELEKVMNSDQLMKAQQKAAEFKRGEHKFAKMPLAMPAPVAPLEHLTTDIRLSSGAVLTDTLQNEGGRGKLTLVNGLSEDAYVKMISNETMVSSFYVRGGETYTFDHVPDGVYRLIYCTGFGWDSIRRDFTRGRRAVCYDELLNYTTTRRTEGATIVTSTGVITLTLHKVANGNAKTSEISLEEFDRY